MTVMCKGKKRSDEFSGFDSLGMSEELVNYSGKKIQDINYQFEKIVPSSCNEIIANKCKKSYFYFLQTFWDVIVNDPPHWNWHIPYLCGQMQIIIERVHKRLPRLYDLVINLPPGTTKSLICTVFLVPWIWTKYPYFRIIKVSYNDHLTLEHADYIRDIVRSEKYQEYFPHVALKFDKSGKSNFRVNFKDEETGFWRLGGGVLSTSVNAKATGFHGHLKITDDPIDPQKAVSDAELKKTNQWISQVLSSRVVDKRIVPEITIMQRVHKKDPSGIAIEKAKKGKKIKHICLPGDVLSKDNRERVNPQILLSQYDKQGGYLDPVRLDETALLELKLNLGQYGYKSQIDQNPVTPGSGMFDVSQIKIIDPGAFNFQANVVRVIRYWDKAGTEADGAYTCGTKMAQLRGNLFLVMDVVRGQWGTHKRELTMQETVQIDGPDVAQYLEQEPGSGGKDSALISKEGLAKFGNKVILDRPSGDKIYRADPFSIAINLGYVAILKAKWNDAWIEELDEFPNSDYKDQVDSASGAYKELKTGKIAGTW